MAIGQSVATTGPLPGPPAGGPGQGAGGEPALPLVRGHEGRPAGCHQVQTNKLLQFN